MLHPVCRLHGQPHLLHPGGQASTAHSQPLDKHGARQALDKQKTNSRQRTCIKLNVPKTQAGNSDSWPIPGSVMNTYCFIMSTFTLPNNFKHTIHPGVGTHQNDNDSVRITQWVLNFYRLSTSLTTSGFPSSSSSRLASSMPPTSSSNLPRRGR